jgi:hypothetical protein
MSGTVGNQRSTGERQNRSGSTGGFGLALTWPEQLAVRRTGHTIADQMNEVFEPYELGVIPASNDRIGGRQLMYQMCKPDNGKLRIHARNFAPAQQDQTIAFELYDNFVFIQVGVNGSEPRSFLLDTGANASFLNEALANSAHDCERSDRLEGNVDFEPRPPPLQWFRVLRQICGFEPLEIA